MSLSLWFDRKLIYINRQPNPAAGIVQIVWSRSGFLYDNVIRTRVAIKIKRVSAPAPNVTSVFKNQTARAEPKSAEIRRVYHLILLRRRWRHWPRLAREAQVNKLVKTLLLEEVARFGRNSIAIAFSEGEEKWEPRAEYRKSAASLGFCGLPKDKTR